MKSIKSIFQVLCFVLCLGLLISCSKAEAPKAKSARVPTVTVSQPKAEKVERIISTIGTLEPQNVVQLATEVSGLIQEIKFEEGQEVKQGEVLVVLDPTTFKLNLDNAQTALKQAKSNLELAETNYDRDKKLYEKQFIPQKELQDTTAALDRTKIGLAKAQTDCLIAEKAFEDSVIKAPIDNSNSNKYSWEVQKRLVSIGEYLNVGKAVAELVNRTTLKLRFTVPEQEAGFLAIGRTVKFTVPALPDKVFEAKIIFIGPEAVESTRSVMVKAGFDNTGLLLRPGYSANVSFIAETKEKAMIISRRSLRFDVDKPYVWIVNDSMLHKRPVTIGVEKEEFVEIVAGINPTDNIVVRSGSFLQDGTKVEVVEDR